MFLRILIFAKRLAVRFFLGLAVLASSGKWPLSGYVTSIEESVFLPRQTKRRILDLHQEFLRSWRLFIEGRYEESVRSRIEVMSEIYRQNGVNSISHWPPYLSNQYVTNVGHIGWLYAHVFSVKSNDIPNQKRYVSLPSNPRLRQFLNTVQDRVVLVPNQALFQLGNLPQNWHNFERIDLVKTHDSFIDIYQLYEKVFTSKLVSKSSPLTQLEDGYKSESMAALQHLGLPEGAWFVTLHIRNDRTSNTRRNQPIENFSEAIRYINSLGGWVVRIGDSGMDPLPLEGNILDLAVTAERNGWLHAYCLAECKFYLGTPSGPAFVAPFFGTPCLITNTTSIGRNTLAMSEHTIYLPKQLIDSNGRLLSFSETLDSPEGYGEMSSLDLQRRFDIRLEPSSPRAISNAVIEIMGRLEGTFQPDESIQRSIDSIRRNQYFSSTGAISQSYIVDNPNWLK